MNDPLLGRLIAQRYRLIAKLGTGGMASVYLARHVLIERLSAIKLVHAELGEDPSYKSRILREAKAVNRINHPNIVEVTDFGESDGLVYLVMEYVPGEPLSKLIERGPLGWRRAVPIALQIASALGRAHQMGVIHRDLKPGNVLLVARREGEPIAKLTDFGVAKIFDATTLTSGTVALGTPGYVAPEYRSLGSIDARVDLYSLGVVLYEATCGTRPLDHVESQRLVSRPAPRLISRAPDIPKFLDEVVMTLLAQDPDDRPRDGFEAYDLLRRVLEGEGIAAGPAPSGHPSQFPDLSTITPTDPPSAPRSSDATPSRPPAKRGPHLVTVTFDRIAPICERALERLERAAAAKSTTAAGRSAVAEAKKLCTMVEAIATMCLQDGESLDHIEARGRRLRSDLGRKLDDLAREHSRTLGWAGTIAERTYLVQSQRASGEHSTPVVDAMIWEEAALETEEDRAREKAASLAALVEGLKRELARESDRVDRELALVTAQLEGRIAALRALALEAWIALADAARRLHVDPDTLA